MKTLLISLTILFALSSSVFAESQRRHGKYYNNHDNSGRYSSHYGKHQEKPRYYSKYASHHGDSRPYIYYSSRPSRHHNDHLPAIIIGAGVLGYILGTGH